MSNTETNQSVTQATANRADIIPNTWNPNRMSEQVFEAEVISIAQFGFVAPPQVRTHPSGKKGKKEIVNGEHRLRALGTVIDRVEDGSMSLVMDALYDDEKGWTDSLGFPLKSHEVCPALADIVNTGMIPIMDLGDISTAHAQRMTVILNETTGSPDDVSLAKLLGELEEEFGNRDAMLGMPYDDAELDRLASFADVDWDALGATIESIKKDDVDGEKVADVTFKMSIPKDWKESHRAILKEVTRMLVTKGDDLPDSKEEMLGRVFFHMSELCGIIGTDSDQDA